MKKSRKKYKYFLLMDCYYASPANVLRIHKKEAAILRGIYLKTNRYYEREDWSKYDNILKISEKYKGTDFIEISKEEANKYCKEWYRKSKEKK